MVSTQFWIYVTRTRACTQHVQVGSSFKTIKKTSILSPFSGFWTSIYAYMTIHCAYRYYYQRGTWSTVSSAKVHEGVRIWVYMYWGTRVSFWFRFRICNNILSFLYTFRSYLLILVKYLIFYGNIFILNVTNIKIR